MITKKAVSTKNLTLKIAEKLFLTHGYFGTSMDALSKELNISKAALYYHFDNKLEILTTLMQPVIENIKQSLQKKLLSHKLEPGFHNYIKVLLEYRTEYPILALIMTMGISNDDLRPASLFVKRIRKDLLLVIENNFRQQHSRMTDLAKLVAKILVGVVFNPLLPTNLTSSQLTNGLDRIINFNKQKIN